MLRLIKKAFTKRYIKFTFIGKHGLNIKTKFSDQDLQDFLLMIYNNSLINDIMNSIKVNNEEQFERVNSSIERAAEEAEKYLLQQSDLEDTKPIIGAISENNNMGRS